MSQTDIREVKDVSFLKDIQTKLLDKLTKLLQMEKHLESLLIHGIFVTTVGEMIQIVNGG